MCTKAKPKKEEKSKYMPPPIFEKKFLNPKNQKAPERCFLGLRLTSNAPIRHAVNTVYGIKDSRKEWEFQVNIKQKRTRMQFQAPRAEVYELAQRLIRLAKIFKLQIALLACLRLMSPHISFTGGPSWRWQARHLPTRPFLKASGSRDR